MISSFYKNKSVAVLGLGISGLATYNFFINKKYNVVAFDDNINVCNTYAEQGLNIIHYNKWDLANLDCIVVSPGISLYYPDLHGLIAKIKKEKINIPIICDIDVLMHFNHSLKYIAITGTNGKSTTVSLLQHILQNNNIKSVLLGNIGVAALGVNFTDVGYVILELSSYQLSIMNNGYSFMVAGILNIKADHLEYHGSFDNYVNAKLKVFNNQPKNGIAIIDNSLTAYKHVIKTDNIIEINVDKPSINISTEYLKGAHNLQNLLFCFSIAKYLNISEENIINAVKTFKGLPHRQQVVANINGVTFINDSKATNPEACETALKTFDNNILILGGVNKRDEIDILLLYLKTNVKYVILIGKSTELFANILQANNIKYFKSLTLKQAVAEAYAYYLNNKNLIKYILFSPACASFDMFKNYNDRGNQFIDIVQNYVPTLNKS